MNIWNNLEEPLRSWTPRAPSPSLSRRLFGPTPHEAAAAQEVTPAFSGHAWQWLAPAMAVFVLGVFVMGRSAPGLGTFSPAFPAHLAAAETLGQPHWASYAAAVHHSEANSVPVHTFEWTNDSQSLRTPAPLPQTNSLKQ